MSGYKHLRPWRFWTNLIVGWSMLMSTIIFGLYLAFYRPDFPWWYPLPAFVVFSAASFVVGSTLNWG